ncbi:MAG: flagellar hook-basal body complex protein FliE [Armatimonadetes bacterium]|nr:flagellar hook-basal body complex protein FliE [Armatimonadota bacterium]
MSLFSSIASSITPTPSFSFPSSTSTDIDRSGSSFGDTLQNALSDVNNSQLHAGALAQDFAAGRTSDVHGVMIASEQATIALQLATQVRNKAVEAYQEIMRISM